MIYYTQRQQTARGEILSVSAAQRDCTYHIRVISYHISYAVTVFVSLGSWESLRPFCHKKEVWWEAIVVGVALLWDAQQCHVLRHV